MATKKSEPREQRRCGFARSKARIDSRFAAASLAASLVFACGSNTPRAKPGEAVATSTAAANSVAAPQPASTEVECLNSEDCSEDLRCCAAEVAGTGLNRCAVECEAAEACTPGHKKTCHREARCEPNSSTRSGGYCAVASPSVVCGAQRCSGNTPGCRYDRKTGKGECVALSPGGGWPDDPAHPMSADLALLRCASPDDCAGERCCTGGPLPMTQCTGMCMSGIDVCDTVQDCPHFIGPPTGCEADPEGPPFLKTCRYGAGR
jgi:hypothetical protein